jgi:hypothetical protein
MAQDQLSKIDTHTEFPITSQEPTQQENCKPLTPHKSKDKYSIVARKTLPPDTTSEDHFAGPNVPVPQQPVFADSSPKSVVLPGVDKISSVQFNLPVTKSADLSTIEENIHSSDSLTQAFMVKNLGGLGKSKWA